MTKNLVIVESPAKAKTISQFLGKDFTVMASMGHVRDLPKSKMGIDTEHDFEPVYSVPQDKKDIISKLKKSIGSKTMIWLATDEDREGEAIAWHILEAIDHKENKNVKRIVFHEITKGAILDAVDNPRMINADLVDAQQARRVLDRLVGYELSPLLWKKVRYGLSAGRVQSVAVRLIVDREREIEAFKPEEYWSITATFEKDDKKAATFEAALSRKGDKKIEVKSEQEAKQVLDDLKGADYKIDSVEQKTVKRYPAPPFITSTLQQEAARKLGYSVKQTMIIAQQLYEGVQVGSKHTGLITYMRTDSVNLSKVAVQQAGEVILDQFGKEYALKDGRFFKGKKGAQEAHEAIRPVDFSILPVEARQFLKKDQAALYELVWKRALASQMAEALLDQTGVDVKASQGDYIFRATGQVIKFPGFMKLYMEGRDEAHHKKGQEEEQDDDRILPELTEGETVIEKGIDPQQHFTKAPPRYTEASLVKKLEAEGIGRPSTYAPTISTVISRGYIEKDGRNLKPTDTAMVVNDLLVEHFPNIVDLQFTARMEEDLDDIADGKKKWVPIIREFYQPFHKDVEIKEKSLKKEDIVNEKSDEICEQCSSPMVIKLGRFGKFLSCSNYPKCKNAKPLNGEGKPVEKSQARLDLEKKLAGKKCEKCGKPMEVKDGRFGEFLACSGYPECKHVQPIIKFTGVKCPKCGSGQMVERRTRKGGKIFYGCNKFPKCKYALWDKPLKATCTKCGGLKVEKVSKKDGEEVRKVMCPECDKKK